MRQLNEPLQGEHRRATPGKAYRRRAFWRALAPVAVVRACPDQVMS